MLNYKLMLAANAKMIEQALAGDKTAKLADLMTARAMIKDSYIAELEARVQALEAAQPKKLKAS